MILRKLFHNVIVWGILARVLSLASSLIILPVLLHFLAKETLALYYVFVALVTLTSVLDFGFSPALITNFAHAYAGVTELQRRGISQQKLAVSNWQLIGKLLQVAKQIYFRLSLLTAAVFYSVGSYYVYHLVKSTHISLRYAIVCWLIYSTASVINMYYMYIATLIQGRGDVNLANKITIVARLSTLLFTVVFLYLGYDLLGLSLALLLSCIIERSLFYKYAFAKNHAVNLQQVQLEPCEFKQYFKLLSHNSFKYGISSLGGYLLTRGTILLVTSYLGLAASANFIFSLQLVTTLLITANTVVSVYIPQLNRYAVQDQKKLLELFSFVNFVTLALYLTASAGLLLFGDSLLIALHSKTHFLPTNQLCWLLLVYLCELQHCNFAGLIATDNNVPFVKAAILSGLAMFFGSWLILQFTGLAIVGIIAAQGLVQLSYNNWYWIYFACRKYKFNYLKSFYLGLEVAWRKAKQLKE